ncbi:hypothetical protein CYMTET_50662 [Cymbomonas tetramitiformis]|uniref:Reverse transcriptase domain-containing protein n=1 Tax=Cymbomonas tetramitiformis TaxID=36881 RepID=A0AAE0BNZ0_9CHLO|nr:hypothetical protein CYMTET_50662 [Cymbomonas tetramitiformis]
MTHLMGGQEDVGPYKLFLLVPRLLLQPVPPGTKKGVAQIINGRCTRFLRGEWEGLYAEAPEERRVPADVDEERVLRDAVRLVKSGQLGKAMKRRRDAEGEHRRDFQEQALELDGRVFDAILRDVPRASGLGSFQRRWKHLWAVHVSGWNALFAVIWRRAVPMRRCGRAAGGSDWCGGQRWADLHTVQAALDRHLDWVCFKADAKNAFNAVHREAAFEAIKRDFPELWAWTDFCYGVEANLGFWLESAEGSVMRFFKLREGAQQGDPLEPLYLAAPLQEAAGEHDRRMLEALGDLLPGGGLAWHSLGFAALPHGMGLTKATRAAMQKVSEAIEEIEGARVADKYLPPRVPKADDVKNLSD